MRIFLVPLLTLLVSTVAFAAPKKTGNELVQAKLLADVASIQPGKPFTVGVLLKIEPGWHIYWLNAGDAGMPTEVHFDLPANFTAGELKFPFPERHTDPGDIVTYGYTNEVMLLATITPPADLKPGETIKIAANASWLVCEKICLPGEAALSIELPVSQQSSEANRELFAKWQKRVPVPEQQFEVPPVRADGPIDASKPEIAVDVFSSHKIGEIFPGPLDGATVIIVKPKKLAKGAVAVVKVTPLPGQSISAKFLEVVVVNSGTDGEPKAYDLRIPIVGSAPAKK